MNVIRIYGGLGNQFFQYALGKLQEYYGAEVRYDVKYLQEGVRPNEIQRKYRLNKFCTNVHVGHFLCQHTVREQNFNLGSLKKKNCNFWGYWQYPEIYAPIIPVLKKDFCVREEFYTSEFLELKARILAEDSVSIHVRRGDYVTNAGFNVLPLQYYTKAVKYVKGNIFVFSDDIPWCKEHFKKGTFVQMEDYLEFELMKLCTHNIIANSTFSWWATFLNDSPNKIVVAPKQWRAREEDQIKFMNKFVLPEEWIKL
jgi:hypothetical protein